MFGMNFGGNTIDCPEARKMVEQGAQLVDVRSSVEFNQAAIPGSKNIPVQNIHVANEHLDKSKPVIVYCASGARSAQAQAILNQMGFDSVHNLGSINKYVSC